MKIIKLLSLFLILTFSLNAQNKPNSTQILKKEKEKVDVDNKKPLSKLNTVYLVEKSKPKNDDKKSIWQLLPLYSSIIQTLIWIILILVLYFIGKSKIDNLLSVLAERIKKGSSIEAGPFKVGQEIPLIVKTEQFAESKLNEKIYGNPDHFITLFKVVTNDLKKSTKAMELGHGCIVQVTTEKRSAIGEWNVAETITFVPNSTIEKDNSTSYPEGFDENQIGYHLKYKS